MPNEIIVNDKAKDRFPKFFSVLKFLFGNGNIFAIGNISVTMGVDTYKQVTLFPWSSKHALVKSPGSAPKASIQMTCKPNCSSASCAALRCSIK